MRVCVGGLFSSYDSFSLLSSLAPFHLKASKAVKPFYDLVQGWLALLYRFSLILTLCVLCLYSEIFPPFTTFCAEMSAIQIIDWGGCVLFASKDFPFRFNCVI